MLTFMLYYYYVLDILGLYYGSVLDKKYFLENIKHLSVVSFGLDPNFSGNDPSDGERGLSRDSSSGCDMIRV